MNPNWKSSDQITLLAVLDPVSQGAGTVTTGWLDASKYTSYLITLLAGAIAATGTLDAKLQQAKDSSGTGAKDITGTSITQLTDNDDNKQVLINLRAEHLDINNGFNHFRLSLTAATAASLICALVQGLHAHFAPGSQVSTVDEVVN